MQQHVKWIDIHQEPWPYAFHFYCKLANELIYLDIRAPPLNTTPEPEIHSHHLGAH